jgi:hypothetical protein
LRKNSRVYIERGGAVFQGFKDILSTDTTVRMNVTAWNALRDQFSGVNAHTNPIAPEAVEFGSWLRDMRRGFSNNTNTFTIRAFNSQINSSQTGGTSTQVRLNFSGEPSVQQPYARNTMYLIGGSWVASDNGSGGGQCPSNGIGVDVFTLNPRGGTFCGYSVGTATSFDVDLAGKSITTTLSDMRLYSNFDFGRDYSAYGPLPVPSDPEYNTFTTALFPAGSKLRFQVGQTTSSVPQLFTTNQVLNGTVSFADFAAMRASFSGNYNSGTATGGNTLGIYTYQTNGTIAAGTTGQKRLRVAFDSTGNAVRWFMCDQSSTTGFTTGCAPVLDSTWSVSTQGGKDVMRFAATPVGIDAQRNSRTLLILHNGSVYFGSEDVLNNKSYSQRLNRDATNAIFRILSGDINFDIATKTTCTTAPC